MGVPTVTKFAPSPPRTGVASLLGDLRISAFTFTFSSSYASPGGETFDPKASNPFEIGNVIGVFVIPPGNATVDAVWDPASKRMKAYWVGPAFSGVKAEVANATNLSVTPGPLTVLVFHR
jgi:hypothetical protein